MNNIQSFSFFDGYYEALKELDEDSKKEVLLAIVEYAFEGIEPNFTGILKALWILIKPSLDISVVRSKAKKSNQNQNNIKSKSNQNQNEIKTESNQNLCSLLEIEKEIEIEKEQEDNIEIKNNNSCSCSKDIKDNEEKLQQLMIKCTGSTNLQALEECISYLKDLPYEVIEQALLKTAEKNASWKYTKTILQKWLSGGITTLEQVKSEEMNYQASKKPKNVVDEIWDDALYEN